jgi:isopentenyl-diphosphate delta-isomerase
MLTTSNRIKTKLNHKSEIGAVFSDDDKTAVTRKQDHIALAFQSQVQQMSLDGRFYYEPMLSAHPGDSVEPFSFLGKVFRAPLWVSSMTGGTAMAGTINHNLARAAGEFGFGMGLGSCRSLLTDDTYLPDFDVRNLIGDNLPLYANLGIAQVEKLIENNQTDLIDNLIAKLRADGLIVHINPMQEWLQPEGDRFTKSPLETLKRLIDLKPNLGIIVKEVGQGMGPESLRALMKLPIMALDFAAAGGTSFSMLELLRSEEALMQAYKPLVSIGHSAEEMVGFVNNILAEEKEILCKEIIISGGIQSFVDGYYLINKINAPAIYGQASAFLKHARGNYDELERFISLEVKGIELAKKFLKIRS